MRFLSRVRLKRNASVRALAPLLLGETGRGGVTRQPAHHLVWSLFADVPDRQRDFLWRELDTGLYLILSARQPQDRHDLFEIAEPKPFTPALESGDRLRFSLRANPIIRRRDRTRRRSIKHDVVMDALRSRPEGDRADYRRAAMQEQGFAWLERQGARTGFTIRSAEVGVDGYDQHRISRKGFGAIDVLLDPRLRRDSDGRRSRLLFAGYRTWLRRGQGLRLRPHADSTGVVTRMHGSRRCARGEACDS